MKRTVLVALLCALLALPALLPGVQGYVDNGPHLVELHIMVSELLPQGRLQGWSDLAEAGQAIGVLNAPLAWGPLALLGWAGVPLGVLYQLAIVLSNVVFGVGVYRLGRELFGREAGLIGAVLAAGAVVDLYGISGSVGGMWPFRLANGVLALGMLPALRRPKLWLQALWLAVLLLLHSYAGVMGAAWLVMCAGMRARAGLQRDTGAAIPALGSLGSLGLGALLTAAYWLPIARDHLSGSMLIRDWGLPFYLLHSAVPLDAYPLAMRGELALVGGLASLPQALLVLAGVGLAMTPAARAKLRPALPTLVPIGLGLFLLVLLASAVLPRTQWGVLGPNPWRYFAYWRLGVSLFAGAGLAWAVASRPWLRWGLLAAVVAGAWVSGARELTLRVGEGAGSWQEMEGAWQLVAQAHPNGAVYVEDTFGDPAAPAGMQNGHMQALLSVAHGLQTRGSWYGVTPTPTHDWMSSEVDMVMLASPAQLAALADPEGWLLRRLRHYRCTHVVSYSQNLGALLSRVPQAQLLGESGAFSVWELGGDTMPMVGVAPGGSVRSYARRGEQFVAEVEAAPGTAFRLRQSSHPWWTAELDGQPVALWEGETDGFVSGELPGSGTLVMRWQRPAGAGGWLSLLGALLTVAAGMVALLRSRSGPR